MNPSSAELQSLARSSCGGGSAYKDMPMLTCAADFKEWQFALINAALNDNTYNVLAGLEKIPKGHMLWQDDEYDDEFNEHLKARASWIQRNRVLVAAMRSHLSPSMRAACPISPEAEAEGTLRQLQNKFGTKEMKAAIKKTEAMLTPKPTPPVRDGEGDVMRFADNLEADFNKCNKDRLHAELIPITQSQLKEAFIKGLPMTFYEWYMKLDVAAFGPYPTDEYAWSYNDLICAATDEADKLQKKRLALEKRKRIALEKSKGTALLQNRNPKSAAGAMPLSTRPLPETVNLPAGRDTGSVSQAASENLPGISSSSAGQEAVHGSKRKRPVVEEPVRETIETDHTKLIKLEQAHSG